MHKTNCMHHWGGGIGCIRFWARSDENSGFHGNRYCFNCIIQNINLIQDRFIKSLVFQLSRNSHSEKIRSSQLSF